LKRHPKGVAERSLPEKEMRGLEFRHTLLRPVCDSCNFAAQLLTRERQCVPPLDFGAALRVAD